MSFKKVEVNHLFVYGTLKRGYPRQLSDEDAIFVGEGMVNGTMYSLSQFPTVELYTGKAVHGEVYEIVDGVISICDLIEGFRGEGNELNFYERTIVPVAINGHKILAYIYFMSKDTINRHRGMVMKHGVWK